MLIAGRHCSPLPDHVGLPLTLGLPDAWALTVTFQALVLRTANHLGIQKAAATPFARLGECPCMACRTNLKKEKRQRNRVNAFRFKKGGFQKKRFNGPDYAAEARKAEEDNKYMAMVFTHAEEEQANKAEASAAAPASA